MSEPKRKERICVMDGLNVWDIVPGEIVRCMDCAFFGESDDMSLSPWCWRDPDHTGHGWPTNEDGYCAWGERMEDGNGND